MPKVWIADKMSERAVEVFRARGIEVDYRPGLSDEEKLAVAGDYDAIAVRSATKLKGALLKAATRVKVIGRAGIGVDNVDVEGCSRRGVVVMNTPFGNTVTTAELAIAHLLAAARQIPQASTSTKAGKWEKNRFMGMELTGKKAGVIGAGNIGAIVCDRLKGLHMAVYVYDPFISNERAEAMGVHKVESVETLAETVDVLTIHVPLVEATRNLINADILARMKDGAILVNCARGGIVDENALYEACKSGKLRAAALDVFAEEPARENPLFTLENVSCTPHIGASTDEAQENVAVQVAEQMADFLLQGTVRNAVNMPSLSEEEARVLMPYMLLCRRLGQLLGQILSPGYTRAAIHFEGQAAGLNRKPLINAVLQGLLAESMEDVNAVNAMVLAKERGIAIDESASERSEHFLSQIRAELTGDAGQHSVAGTVFDAVRPRLISIDSCEIEMAPEGRMLFVRNYDRPGVVAGIGAALAAANINIGDFRLGRNPDMAEAIALVTVDSQPPVRVMEQMRDLPNIIDVRYLELRS
jgi:D-3-phosphoglycerate dehydrogenase / 2-oxoglutarate reductase